MVTLGWTHIPTCPLPEPEVYPQEGWQLYFCQVVVCVSGTQKVRERGTGSGGGWHWGQDPERKTFPVGHHPFFLTSWGWGWEGGERGERGGT